MLRVRKAEERGHFDHGWLDTYHTFSFADYYDARFEGFRDLRVLNEDRVRAGRGFGTHGHRDMEILTYVLEGGLAHRDSLGNGSTIHPGMIQRMSAGTGIQHSEWNASETEGVHLLQIWILPEKKGLSPSYEENTVTLASKPNTLHRIASREGGTVKLHQDVSVYAALLEPGRELAFDPPAGRHAWIQVARGSMDLNGTPLEAGDGCACTDEERLTLTAKQNAEILLFDLR